MYAWVTINRDHKPYLSTIFARAIHKGNWGKYEKGYHEFCIVLNEDKTKLISLDTYQLINKNIEVHVATVDADMKYWKPKNYYGCVDFLAKYDPETLSEEISKDDLQKCIDFDKKYHYEEWYEIKTEKDAEIMLDLTGGFHDAPIEKLDIKDDQMKIVFGKAWGIQMEVVFKGNPVFKLNPDIDEYSWWPDCSLFVDKGKWYLCDLPEVTSISEDKPNMYFGGKNIQYRMLPGCYKDDAERIPKDIEIIDER